MKKQISVIIPVYNTQKYIGECLQSIVNQTLGIKNIEVIIINDCTSDHAMGVVFEYKKCYPDNFVVINNDKNKGLGASRNIGLKKATGEFISFVDSDDFLDVDVFEYGIKKIKENNVDIFLYQFEYFNEVTGQKFTKQLTDLNYKQENRIIKKDEFAQNPNLIFEVSTCNKIYKKKSLKKNVLFTQGHKFEDVYFSLIHMMDVDIFLSNRVKYNYRKRAEENSITDLSFKSVKNFEDQIDELLRVKKIQQDFVKLRRIFDWFLLYSWTTFLHHLLLDDIKLTQQQKKVFFQKTKELWQDIDIDNIYERYIEMHHKKLYNFVFHSKSFDKLQKKYRNRILLYKLHSKLFKFKV